MPSKGKKTLYVILGIAIVLLLNLAGGSFIKNIFYTVSYSAQEVLYRAGDGLSNLFDGLFTASSLKKANQELVKQNILLKKSLSELESYEKENAVLRQVLGLSEQEQFQLILADVLSMAPEQDVVLISAGAADGAAEDMPVVTEYGVLVGKVGRVFKHFSDVILISSPSIAFDVEIQASSTDNVLAAVKGEGLGKIFFGLVPQDTVIKNGDIVKTAALGGKFPKGLLVGEISSFRKNDAESFQGGAILPYFTNLSLQRVFLITNFNIPYDDE